MEGRKTAISLASKKLKQAKENVIDQFKNVDDYILSLKDAESELDLACLHIQKRLENEVEFAIKALNKKKSKLLNDLKSEREEKSSVISVSEQFAMELAAKSKEVRTCDYPSFLADLE